MLAQIIHGIGFTPMFTLGTVYLDDNSDPNTAALYVGKYEGRMCNHMVKRKTFLKNVGVNPVIHVRLHVVCLCLRI